VLSFVFNQIQQFVIRDYEKSHSQLINSYANYVERVLQTGVAFTNTYAERIAAEHKTLSQTQLNVLLAEVLQKDSIIFGVAVAIEKNAFPNSGFYAPYVYRDSTSIRTVDLTSSINYFDASVLWYSLPKKTLSPLWTNPYEAFFLKGKKLVTYAVPLISDSVFLGIIQIDFDLATLDEYVSAVMERQKGRFVIVNQNGQYITHPDSKRIKDLDLLSDTSSILPKSARVEILNGLKTNHAGYLETKHQFEFTPLLAFYSPIEIGTWGVVVYQDKETLLSEYNTLFTTVYLLLGFLSLLATISVLWVINRILRPMGEIKKFASVIGRGNYSEKLRVATKDEFEDLSIDLNAMSTTLAVREKELKEINAELESRVAQRTSELTEAHNTLTEIYKHVSDSIEYAQRIQHAMLPGEELFQQLIKEHFVLFLPKDKVSGDFYWLNTLDGKIVLAQADCTGHGVPGALMAMIGNTLLNEIVLFDRIDDPGRILSFLDFRLREELNKNKNIQTKDGMDISVCVIDKKQSLIKIAAARRPVVLMNHSEQIEIKGDKQSIGDNFDGMKAFTTHSFEYQTGDMVYLFSDGYPDQNNTENKKFGKSHLLTLLNQVSSQECSIQKEILMSNYAEHKGREVQRDDVTILGIRL